jgi:lysophospholipase L1-like esterase
MAYKNHRLAWLSAFALATAVMGGAGVAAAKPHWIGTWSTPQQVPEPANALPAHSLDNATLRQLVRTSVGGSAFRIRVSNTFGTGPLRIDSVHVARAIAPNSSQIDTASDRAVTFSGQSDIVVPAGAEYLSDPVTMPIAPLTTLAISMHFSDQPTGQTGHPGSRATSYLMRGDHVADAELAGATKIEHWYFLTEVDAAETPQSFAVAVVGDSITDGHGVPTDSNERWTDVLAQRLVAAHRTVGVLNLGIGGNRILLDGLGPNAVARFDRDVIDRPGVKYLIVLEGVNDLGTSTRDHPISAEEHRALVQHIIAGYAQMIVRAHDHGIKAIGATIMPYAGSGYYHPDAANEADRQAINAWIRTPGHFDAVVDFDKLMRDPKRPTYLRPDFDLGDGLHPSVKGYQAMGDAVPLSLFR